MALQMPGIDNRSAEDIVNQVKASAGWVDVQNDAFGEALVRIFARYCEIIIERLNQVPDKNYRAFLNTLGVFRNPPLAAQVPLTFTPVKSAANTMIVVPQGTKAAAPPGEGEDVPAVFETVQALTLTSAQLQTIIALDTQLDRYADLSILATPNQDVPGAFPFQGSMPIQHEFFINVGNSLAVSAMSSLELFFTIGQQTAGTAQHLLQWQIEAEDEDQIIVPEKDTTMALSQSGVIVFNNLPKWEVTNRGGVEGHWLSCRLLEFGDSANDKTRKKARLSSPILAKVEITGHAIVEDAKIDMAYFNGITVDLSKDFYPLGERPQFGDVLYLNSPVFTSSATDVTVNIKLTNPASGKHEPPIRRVNQNGMAKVQWEYWNGGRWESLKCSDTTQALTEDGEVSFEIPEASQKALVNGLQGDWLRVRLTSGHYGVQESFQFNTQGGPGQGVNYLGSTLAPPAIAMISVSSSKKIGPKPPSDIITHNDFVFETIDVDKDRIFTPFQFEQYPVKALYFGFKAINKEIMSGRWLDLYIKIQQPTDKIFYRGDQQFPVVNWQCWNGSNWEICKVKDDTLAFNVTNVISILIPESIASRGNTSMSVDSSLYWLRAIWVSGEYQCKPLLQHILLNTTLARHVLTHENEILGSGNGTPDQVFYSARSPIIDKPIVEIREPQLPGMAELANITSDEGEGVIDAIQDKEVQKDQEIWVRWHGVNDFLESDSHDRHFVVEHLSGEIRFGNGLQGMLPPVGANNIRLRFYKTGGGKSGNKPINSIAQLRSSLPLIASVTNPEAAYGGQNMENWDSVYNRGSRQLRHRGLAITAEDYQDIAMNASPEVARAKCFPLQDLEFNKVSSVMPGVVSLVIVPQNSQLSPRPSLDLLRRIWKYLDQFRVPGTTLVVLGPEYVRINVKAVIVPANEYEKSDICADCVARLEAFLHPLTGGDSAKGWDFSVIPHQSDLFAVLEAAPGLEYVRSLQIGFDEESPGLLKRGNFLSCSGKHRITLG